MVDVKDYVQEVQEHLHSIPEPAFEEYKTSTYIAHQLQSLGYDVHMNIAQTGVVGYMKGKKGSPCVAIRGDMDCIIHEEDGEITYRHSCGHDAHSSIALGLAKYFSTKMDQLNGSIKFIFQPAEEIGQGAKAMVEAGALEDVDAIIGYHLRTDHECKFGQMSPALLHSAGTAITGEVVGVPSHGGRPHLGKSAVDVLHALMTNVALIRTDPMAAANIKFTQISAGQGSLNVIPGNGRFGLDVRSGTNAQLEELLQKVRTIFEQTEKMYGVLIPYEIKDGVPAPNYDPVLVETAKEAITEELGYENMIEPIFTPGGEDFHYYGTLTNVKTAYLAIGAEVSPGLHDPNMTFNKDAMDIAVRVVSRMVEKLFER